MLSYMITFVNGLFITKTSINIISFWKNNIVILYKKYLIQGDIKNAR